MVKKQSRTERLRKTVASQDKWFLALTGSSALFLVTYGLFMLFKSLDAAAFFQGYAADGPFQLYNPLRRLDAGQLVGRDFQFFHGSGVPLLFYLPFKLLGSNIFASELSRWLVSVGLFLLSSFVFFWAALQSKAKAVIATALMTSITLLVASTIIEPSNSLLGVRGSLPIFVAAVLAWRTTRRLDYKGISVSYKTVLVIPLLAASLLCGTEQGLAALLAYFALRAFEIIRDRRLASVKRAAIEGIGVIACVLLFTTIVSGGHPFKPLTYALKTAPAEQFWYYGTPPSEYLSLHNIGSALNNLSMLSIYVVIVTVFLLIFFSRKLRLLTDETTRAYSFLALAGFASCVSMLGYFHPSQGFPLVRSFTLIAISSFLIIIFSGKFVKSIPKTRYKKYYPLLPKALFAVTIIGLLVATGIYAQRLKEMKVVTTLKASQLVFHKNDYQAVALTKSGWQLALDAFPELKETKKPVWSAYASLYESSTDRIQPDKNGFDYIIHALGDENTKQYHDQFIHDRTPFALTLKQTYFPYEEWLWSRHSPFYVQLFTNYEVTRQNSSHYLWKYVGGAEKPKAWTPIKLKRPDVVNLPTTREDLTVYEVTVTYDARTSIPSKRINALPRYFLNPADTGLIYSISLPPQKNTWTFIVPVFKENKKPTLNAVADGLIPGAKLTLKNASYRPITVKPENLTVFYNNHCNQKMIGAAMNDEIKSCKTQPLDVQRYLIGTEAASKQK
jgi:hypothetical protein